VIAKVQKRVALSLEADAQALITDLLRAFETLQQEPNQISIFVEQATTLKVLTDTMLSLTSRYDQIKRLSKLCDHMAVSNSVLQKVNEGEVLIKQLPSLVRQAEQGLEQHRSQMEADMN